MNATRSILDLVTIFPWAIVLALALVEAFKTVVEEGKFIHWNGLYSLCSFLLLILPFYQGMNRYLLVTYGDVAALPTSGPFLVSAEFMVESALFFVLSRTLRPEEWQHFYWVVVVLLVFDSIWWILRAPPHATIQGWTILNLVTSIFILALLLLGRRLPYQPHLPAAIGTAAMLVRTIIDYWVSWSLFFPPPLRLNMP